MSAKRILSLDLQGKRLGYAVLDGSDLVTAGVILLGVRHVPGKSAHHTRRVLMRGFYTLDLRLEFKGLLKEYQPDVVAYENVVRHGPGIDAAHAWGAAKHAILETLETIWWGQPPEQPYPELVEVGVKAAKLALARSGNATKEEMVAAARARWPQAAVAWDAEDGDAADAAAVGLALTEPGETKAAAKKREAAERKAAKATTTDCSRSRT